MKRALLILVCLSTLAAVRASSQSQTQQSVPAPNAEKFTNADVIALTQLGLSDDIIISKIRGAKATQFDVTVGGLTALKAAKVSDPVIRAMLDPQKPDMPPNVPDPAVSPAQGSSSTPAPTGGKPRIYFQSKSSGNTWNASRDQSMEMGKDFDKDCPDAQITLVQQAADYTIVLSHIELGLMLRDNQVQIADKNGDLISKTKEGSSIRATMKKACEVIMEDWAKKTK